MMHFNRENIYMCGEMQLNPANEGITLKVANAIANP